MTLQPQPSQEGERLAAEYRASDLHQTEIDATPKGLAQIVTMLDTWIPDALPANELGQIPFARAMAESAADTIRTYLTLLPAAGGPVTIEVNALKRVLWRLAFDQPVALDNPGDGKWRMTSTGVRVVAAAVVAALQPVKAPGA